MKLFSTTGLATALAVGLITSASAETELTMYYPIAVGGKLTEVVDGIVDKFEAANPDISVNAIYSGNYDDTRVRALSALASGEPAQLAVMFSIDAYDLIEQDLVVPFEDVATSDADKEWLGSFYPALMANGQSRAKHGASRSSAQQSLHTTTRTCSAQPDLTQKRRQKRGMR